MKYVLILILILLFTGSAAAQTELEIANQRLDKTITLLEKRDAEIVQLKTVIEKLQAAQLTPCVVALNVYTDQYLKLPVRGPENSKQKNQDIARMRKDLTRIWSKSVQSQCGFKDGPKWWTYLLQLAPFGAVLLK